VTAVTKAVTESTTTTKTSPSAKATANSTAQQMQTSQQAQVVQTVQRIKPATMTLAPVTATQGTKNAIVVTNTGQTAQVIPSINLNQIMN